MVYLFEKHNVLKQKTPGLKSIIEELLKAKNVKDAQPPFHKSYRDTKSQTLKSETQKLKKVK